MPARSRSYGREAFSGVSLKPVDNARAAQKPAIAKRQIGDSVPPATITSASPSAINRLASPIACAPVAHDGMVGTLEALFDRDVPRSQVDQATGNEERRDLARSPLLEQQRGVGDTGQTADARADHGAG